MRVHEIPRRLRTGVVLALMAIVSPAVSQTLPPTVDAGTIARENLRNQGSVEQEAQPAKIGSGAVPKAAQLPVVTFPAGGTTFLLKRVEFSPSKFLSQETLDAIVAPYLNTRVDLSKIQAIVNAVNEIYTQRNLVTASADLPPQKLDSGVLRIRLVEGRLGELTVTGAVQNPTDFYTRRIRITPGETIDVPELNSEINLFNRVNDAQIKASLQPGTSFGLTDIALAAIEPPKDLLEVFGDNFGVTSVGAFEGGLLYRHYGLLGSDDKLSFYGLGARGDLVGNVAYSIAVTPTGGRVGLSYTRGGIKIVEGPFEALNITGSSQIGAVNFSHPLFINNNFFIQAVGSVADDISSTNQGTTPISQNQTVKGSAGVSASYVGDMFNLTVTPTYSRANSRLLVTDDKEDYNLVNGILQGSARLPYGFNAILTAVGQYSSEALLPGDQLFQIGGPLSVRGYTSNAIAGDSGYYFNAELHHGLPELYKGLDLFAFFDNGTVFSTFPTRTTLTAAGGGINLNVNDHVSAQIFVGVPLKSVLTDQAGYQIYGRLVLTAF